MEFDERTVWAFVLVIIAALALRYLPRYQARSPFVDPEVLRKRMEAGDDVVVVDVRTESEFAGRLGRLPGSVNVPVADLKMRLNAADRELGELRGHPVFVYCTGELRAARGARALRDAGFNRVSVIRGGLKAWIRRGYPLERAS